MRKENENETDSEENHPPSSGTPSPSETDREATRLPLSPSQNPRDDERESDPEGVLKPLDIPPED